MKIIFLGAYDTPDFGGLNSYVLNMSLQLEQMGHQCISIRQSDHYYVTTIEGIKFINIAIKGPKMAGTSCYPKAINYVIKNNLNPDVVVFQSYFMAPFFDWRLKKKGFKVCYVQHSFACDNPKNNIIVKVMERVIERFTALWAKNIITVGENMARLVNERLHVKPAIVRGGIFMSEKESQKSDIMDRFGLNSDGFYLTIARIDPIKNLHVLIKAFKQYKGDKKLVIGGNINNSYGQHLVKISKDDNRIKLVGPLLNVDKDTILRNCFAYCMVSSSEGFPISLLEAMSYGKRCITSHIAPNVEAMSEKLGIWCEPGSTEDITKAMTDIECNDKYRTQLENKIKTRVKDNFTWESSAKAFLEYVATL